MIALLVSCNTKLLRNHWLVALNAENHPTLGVGLRIRTPKPENKEKEDPGQEPRMDLSIRQKTDLRRSWVCPTSPPSGKLDTENRVSLVSTINDQHYYLQSQLTYTPWLGHTSALKCRFCHHLVVFVFWLVLPNKALVLELKCLSCEKPWVKTKEESKPLGKAPYVIATKEVRKEPPC